MHMRLPVRLSTAAIKHDVVAAFTALDWVVRNATRPAVCTLSLGIPVGAWSRALEAAARRVLAAGILVVVAAGALLPLACPKLGMFAILWALGLVFAIAPLAILPLSPCSPESPELR